MNKNLLLQKILNKKEIKDYTYATLFFLTSSFFILFAVKPTLSIAFSLQKEASDLRQISEIYENNISKITKIQSGLEIIRDEKYLLNEAIPDMPQMRGLVDSIKQAASDSGVIINILALSKIDLKKTTKKNQLTPLKINLEVEGGFPTVNSFTQKIIDQRRVTTINKLMMFRKNIFSTESARLTVEMEIEAFYL